MPRWCGHIGRTAVVHVVYDRMAHLNQPLATIFLAAIARLRRHGRTDLLRSDAADWHRFGESVAVW